jgi:uncharacterized LabA/DUF88 family protein
MTNRGRTIVYFDNSNIFRGQSDAGWRIDAEKLIFRLAQDGDIWQTHFFAAVTDPPRYTQTAFYRMLKEKLRWETVLFPLGNKTFHCRNCNKIHRLKTEKGVDVAIATKMLTHAINKAFDTAILLSGDKDYLDTVRTVKNLGLRVEIVSFRHSLSPDLARESSASVIFLDELQNEIELAHPDREAEKLESSDEAG